MSPSKRFKPVQRIAKSREQRAAKQFGDSQRSVKEQETKLEELKRYHSEYIVRFEENARNGISATQLMEYRAFLDKLEMAIGEQEKIVHASRNACTSRKGEWQQRHARTEVIGKVMDRLVDVEQKVREKHDQKESDEHGLHRQSD